MLGGMSKGSCHCSGWYLPYAAIYSGNRLRARERLVFERAETGRSVCLRQKILLYSEARDRDFGLQI